MNQDWADALRLGEQAFPMLSRLWAARFWKAGFRTPQQIIEAPRGVLCTVDTVGPARAERLREIVRAHVEYIGPQQAHDSLGAAVADWYWWRMAHHDPTWHITEQRLREAWEASGVACLVIGPIQAENEMPP